MPTNSGTTVAQDPSPTLFTPPLAFTVNSCLSEDHLLTTDILIDGGSSSPVAMWQNAQGQSEALGIGSDSQLSHLHRDPNSDSGQNLQPVAQNLKVSEVVAAKDGDGAVNAFVVDSTNQLHQLRQNADGTWPAPTDLGCKATNIGVAQQVDDNDTVVSLVVCGVTAAGHLLLVTSDPTTGAWGHQDYPDNLAGVSLQLVPQHVFGDVWTLSLFASIDGQVRAKTFNPKAQPYPQQWKPFANIGGATLPNHVLDLTVVPGSYSSVEGVPLLAIDTDNQLFTIQCYVDMNPDPYNPYISGDAAFYQVSGVEAIQASATYQADDPTKMQVYMIDATDKLWVLRQSGSTRIGQHDAPMWYTPVPLDDHLLRTFTPAGANDRAEVFALDTASTARSLSQDPKTTQWTSLPVQQSAPPDEPAHVSSYLTTASLEDANGVPVAGARIAITSKAPATIWVDGVAYDVGPNEPATCQTDPTGKLNIMSLAMGLDTPPLYLATDGLDQTTTVTPYQEVHDYLAGSAETLNDIQQPFDGPALKNAKGADGQWLAPDLTDDGAQAVAVGIKQTMTLRPPSSFAASGASPAARLGRPLLTAAGEPATGWTMDFSDPNTPTFTPVSAQEIADHRTQLQGQLLGSIWDDLKKFAGDVWHAIKKEAMTLKTLVVDAVNKTVSLTLSIADQVGHLLDVAIDKIEDVVHVIHTVFAAIGAEIERVVEWLRALFNWDDILNTYKVLEYYIGQQAIPQLQKVIEDHAQPLVKGFFTRLQKDIEDHCDEMKALLEQIEQLDNQGSKKTTLADLAAGNLSIPNGQTPTVAQPSIDPRAFYSHPHHNWLFAKLLAYIEGATDLNVTADGSLKGPFEEFTNAVESALPDFKDALQELEAFFRGVVAHPADFNQLVVEDLIDVIKHMLVGELKVADGIIEALLGLVDAALSALNALLNKQLNHIPLLSALFKDITHEDLTAVRLWSLLMAIPITLTYKLLNGVREPLFTDDMVAQLTSPPGSTETLLGTPADAGPNENEQELSERLGIASAGVQALWAINDVWVDGLSEPESDDEDEEDKTSPAEKAGIVIWGLVGIAFPIAAQLLWWPNDSGDLRKGTPTDTPYHKWNLAMWALYWPPPLIDSLLLAGTATKWVWPATKPLLRYNDPAGKIFLTVIGWGIFAASIGASIEGQKHGQMSLGYPPLNGYDISANVLGPLSYTGQILLLKSIQDSQPWGLIAFAAQLLNNIVTGLGCAITMYLSAKA
jgi:hypothetical protein